MRKINLSKYFLGFLPVTLFSIFLAACGGGSGGGTASTTQQGTTQQGIFLDALVQGVSYSAGSITGTTDANGNFTYKPGDTITFKIGDIVLGTVTATPIITPLSLTSASSTTDQRVINMVRFLLTLDDDGNPDNGIQITDALRAAASGQTVDFNMTPSAFGSDGNVVNALSAMVKGSRALVNQTDAQTHFDSTIIAMQKSLAGDYSGTFSGGNSGTWSITVDANGNIIGSGKSNTTGSFAVSGKIDSSGRGAFGAGGSADFIGFFSMNGCFAGSWVDHGVSPNTSGTFSGSKVGSSANNCDSIAAEIPRSPTAGNDKTGANLGGTGGTVSGTINISGNDQSIIGGTFSPTRIEKQAFIDNNRVVVSKSNASTNNFWTLNTLFDKQSDAPLAVRYNVASNFSITHAYFLDCIPASNCTGIKLDKGSRTVTFTDVVLVPISTISSNQATGTITLNGAYTFNL